MKKNYTSEELNKEIEYRFHVMSDLCQNGDTWHDNDEFINTTLDELLKMQEEDEKMAKYTLVAHKGFDEFDIYETDSLKDAVREASGQDVDIRIYEDDERCNWTSVNYGFTRRATMLYAKFGDLDGNLWTSDEMFDADGFYGILVTDDKAYRCGYDADGEEDLGNVDYYHPLSIEEMDITE